jgi:hypothetical protein
MLRERPYPKGYVTMLEAHQDRLVRGLQEMYHRLLKVGEWDISPLAETDGKPSTHDILGALGLSDEETNGSGAAPFEGDRQRLTLSLDTEPKGHVQRQELVSSILDCGQHVFAEPTSHHESIGSNLVSPTERIGITSTIPSPPTRSKTIFSRVPDYQQAQSTNTQSLHHLLQCANDQRSGALEPNQKVNGLDDSLQATNSSLATLTTNWNNDMGCVMEFQWDQIRPFDDIDFDICAPYSACRGADAFNGGLRDIIDIYFD